MSRYLKQAKSWHFEVENLSQDLSQSTSYALYVEGAGFLNSRDFYTKSLASAQHFESLAAAEKKMKKEKRDNTVIVGLKTSLNGFIHNPTQAQTYEIQQGLSLYEKEQLKTILQNQDIQQKLQLLEQLQQEHPEWFEDKLKSRSSLPPQRL